MCGIAGLISGGRTRLETIEQLIAPLYHRGPDDGGTWIDSNAGVALGHRRLSIVDLSRHGHQPMISSNGRIVLTYNGELYNAAEIRGELEAGGHVGSGGWRGHSDTEILLQAISTWGLKRALARAVGMFAFALWDKKERRLSLVRDRFGEKPLYYGWVGGDFVFGSELKALVAHPGFDNSMNPKSVRSYVSNTFIPAPLSIYRRIFKLEPGCILSIAPEAAAYPSETAPAEEEDSDVLKLVRYWSYADVVKRGLEQPISNEDEAALLLEETLAKAVGGQAVTDVPVGAFLSGGVDSSTVVAIYQKYSGMPVRSFTIGFRESKYNEAVHAKAIAQFLGTVHEEHYVTDEEAREVIPMLPRMYDEPFGDSSQIPTFLVSRFARRQVKVALSGDGADELFAGYSRYAEAVSAWQKVRAIPWRLRHAAAPFEDLSGIIISTAEAFLGDRFPIRRGKALKAVRVAAGARTFDDFYDSFLDQWAYEAAPVEGSRPARSSRDIDRDAPAAVRMGYADVMQYLPDAILCKVDRASMAVSLEGRSPFLDHRVAEVAARIPIEMKLRGGSGKAILRKLLARHVPRELFERPKSGFSMPVGEWLKGSLRPWAEDLLDERKMTAEGWLDAQLVRRRWHQHLTGQRDSSDAMWAILMFQCWMRQE